MPEWITIAAAVSVTLLVAAAAGVFMTRRKARATMRRCMHLTTSGERFHSKLERIRGAVYRESAEQFRSRNASHCKALKVALVLYAREYFDIQIRDRIEPDQRQIMIEKRPGDIETIELFESLFADLANASWEHMDKRRFLDLLEQSSNLTQAKTGRLLTA